MGFNLSRLNNKHFLSLFGSGILAVFGLLTIKVLYHVLSLHDVGIWFYFLMIQSLCDGIRNGFLSTTTVKFYAGTEGEKASSVLGSVWLLATLVTAALLLINLAAFFFMGVVHTEEVVVTIKWLGLTFLSSLPFSVIFWKLQADEDYAKIIWLRLVNSGSTIAVFIALIFLKKMTLEAALLYNFITNCLTSVVGVLLGWGRVRTIFKATKNHSLELAHFGKFSLATSFSSTMLGKIDGFIIEAMLGPAAMAIYSLPVRLMELVEIPLRSFVATGLSSMAVAFNSHNMDRVCYIMKKYSGMLTMAFIPLSIGGILFSNYAMVLLGDPKLLNTAAPMIFRFMMVFSLMYPIERFNGVTLDIIHRPKVNFYKVLIMISANIAADFIGIYFLKGIEGIIFGVFCTTFSGLLFGYFQLRKSLDYTIGGILISGYQEMIAFLKKNLKLAS